MSTCKVIITGASGFIGSELVDKLRLINGLEIIPVSRSKKEKTYLHVHSYKEAPSGDILIHLAEPSDRGFVNNADQCVLFKNIENLDFLLNNNYQNIIYCSSSSVYGDSGRTLFSENDVIEPYDQYSTLKFDNEKKILSHGGVVLRLTNVIGRNMAKNNVLSDIISQMPGSEPILVQDTKPIRDFVAIGDVVDALLMMTKKGGSGVYNIGTGIGVSIKDLAEVALKIHGEIVRPIKPLKQDTIDSFNVVNIEKVKNAYDWAPKISLVESIRELI